MLKKVKFYLSGVMVSILMLAILLPTVNAEEDLELLTLEIQDDNSELVSPYGSGPSKPTLQNPGGGFGAIGNFNTAKSVGGKTLQHTTQSTTVSNSLPTTSTKYSSKDLVQNGLIKQRRYYDELGQAVQDVDYFHSGEATHNFPHLHYFTWSGGAIQGRTTAYPAQF